jgi:hypothetical protein
MTVAVSRGAAGGSPLSAPKKLLGEGEDVLVVHSLNSDTAVARLCHE